MIISDVEYRFLSFAHTRTDVFYPIMQIME